MSVHLQKFTVSYEYPVCFTREAFAPDNLTLLEVTSRREPQKRHRLLFLVEEAVARATPDLVGAILRYGQHHEARIDVAGEPVVVAGGEAMKNDPDAPLRLQIVMNRRGMDRHSFVVILGGGALQDAAGYAAATCHRGLRTVRFPTTVLGQADSGVGVKNGINCFGKKNFLGTFAPPWAVVNDLSLLSTLPRRDKLSGMSEAAKVALIRDGAFFDWMRRSAGSLAACDPEAMAVLIRRSAELHMTHIATSGDPFENGSARPLDFGHWAAHKLESLTEHRLRHGEAVAIGVALDTLYSARIGLLEQGSVAPVLELLRSLGLALWDEALDWRHPDGRRVVMDGIDEFREHLGGELTLTMLRDLGAGVEVTELDEGAMAHAMDALREAA